MATNETNFFTWGKELSPEAREATNAALNAYCAAHNAARAALDILRGERVAFDRTRAEIAQQIRIDGEAWAELAGQFERWAQEQGAAPSPTALQTAEAVRLYATQKERIYNTWAKPAEALAVALRSVIEQANAEHFKAEGVALQVRECMTEIAAALLDEVAKLVSSDLLEPQHPDTNTNQTTHADNGKL